MSAFEIRPCTLAHLRDLALHMRAADRAEIAGAGRIARHLLIALWRRSLDPRVGLLDGHVAAAWGDEAGLLDEEGAMWLFTTPLVERLPLAFFRQTRAEIAERLQVRRRLISEVAEDYTAALRFFRLLGFEIGEARAAPSGMRYCCMTICRPGTE